MFDLARRSSFLWCSAKGSFIVDGSEAGVILCAAKGLFDFEPEAGLVRDCVRVVLAESAIISEGRDLVCISAPLGLTAAEVGSNGSSSFITLFFVELVCLANSTRPDFGRFFFLGSLFLTPGGGVGMSGLSRNLSK